MFIKSIAPLLNGGDKVKVEISAAPQGKLTVLITPLLSKFDPETVDPVIAARQAALARPIVITLNASGDPDAELHDALTSIHPVRQDIAANHAAYLDDLAKAEAAAKAVAAEVKAKAKRPPAKAPALPKPADGAANADADAEGEGDETGDTPALPPPTPALSQPAPESAAGLFD